MSKKNAGASRFDDLRQTLEKERDAVLTKSAPLHKERQKLLDKIQPLEAELQKLNERIAAVEEPLQAIGRDIARAARVGGARTLTNDT